MGTAQRHILGTFLYFLVLVLFIILGLTILVDFVEKLDDFLTIIEETGATYLFPVRYYAYQTPLFLAYLIPVILLIAGGITVVRMVRSNELIPLYMSGQSIYKLFIPVYVCFLVGGGAIFAIHQWVLPASSVQMALMEVRLDEGDVQSQVLAAGENDVYLHAGELDFYEKKGRAFTVMEFGDRRLTRIVEGTPGFWRGATNGDGDQPGWVLEEGRDTRYTSRQEREVTTFSDARQVTTGEDLSPDRILVRQSDRQFYTFGDLLQLREQLPFIPALSVQLHYRIAYPLIAFLLPAFGISVMLRREITSYFLGALICAVVAIGFYIVMILSMELGDRAVIHPILSAWLPAVLLAALTMVLYDRILT